jgi:hypothetical protein
MSALYQQISQLAADNLLLEFSLRSRSRIRTCERCLSLFILRLSSDFVDVDVQFVERVATPSFHL